MVDGERLFGALPNRRKAAVLPHLLAARREKAQPRRHPNRASIDALWEHQMIRRLGSLDDRDFLEFRIRFPSSNDQLVVTGAQEKIFRDKLVIVESSTPAPRGDA